MERIGTSAAAVPAAMTSVKVGSSSYLIWWAQVSIDSIMQSKRGKAWMK